MTAEDDDLTAEEFLARAYPCRACGKTYRGWTWKREEMEAGEPVNRCRGCEAVLILAQPDAPPAVE